MQLYRSVRDSLSRVIKRNEQSSFGTGRGYRESLKHAISCGIEPDIVYDVGAGTGTPWLYEAFPHATHMLFEPLPKHVEKLRKSYSYENFKIHEVAVGSEKTLGSLHIPSTRKGKTTWSSLLRTSKQMESFTKAWGVSSEGKDITVQIFPLDNYAQFSRSILKIDTEGSELDILKGARKVLSRCQLLIIELSIFPRWDGEGRFAEIVSFLDASGFELFDIPLLWYPMRKRDLTLIDAIFVPTADRRAGKWIGDKSKQ